MASGEALAVEMSQPRETSPDLSIVIVSYECRERVMRCLESLERDAEAYGYEVFVVDNGSTDGTIEAIRGRFTWPNLMEAQENLGFSAANNLALRRSAARRVLLLNPDTVVPRGAIPEALVALDGYSDVGMLGVKLVQEDGTLDHACKRGFPTPGSALAYFTGVAKFRPTSPRLAQYTAGHVADDEVSPVDAVNGAFMLVRREALDEVGYLDEEFWLYMEDLDWCFRFWQSGWKVLYWPLTTVVHAKAGSSGKARAWRTNHAFHRGMWLFYKKHYAPDRAALTNRSVQVVIYAKLLGAAASSWVRRQAGVSGA